MVRYISGTTVIRYDHSQPSGKPKYNSWKESTPKVLCEIELGVLITRGPVWVRIRGIDFTPKSMCELELGVLIYQRACELELGVLIYQRACELELGVLIYQRAWVSYNIYLFCHFLLVIVLSVFRFMFPSDPFCILKLCFLRVIKQNDITEFIITKVYSIRFTR